MYDGTGYGNELKMKTEKELKKRVCVSMDSQLHHYVRRKGLNLSRFLENAVKRLKLNLTDENDTMQNSENADLVLVCQNNMPSPGIEPGTYRSSVCRNLSPRNDGVLGKRNENSGFQNFSGHAENQPDETPSRRKVSPNSVFPTEFPIMVDGKELRGIPGCSPAAWFTSHPGYAGEFSRWHNENKRNPDKNTNSYINAIRKMDYILIPDDWIGRRVTSIERVGFDLLLSFFNSKYHTGMKFNGYDRVDWSEARKRTISNKGTRVKTVVKDATLKEAYHHMLKIKNPDEKKEKALKVFYTLLLYSGARVSQLYQFYEDMKVDKEILDPTDYQKKHVSELFEEFKDCVRFNVRYLGFDYKNNRESSKRTTYYYFPKELKNAALNYRNPYTYSVLCVKLGVKENAAD